MPAWPASIPIVGLKIGKRLRKGKREFSFFLLNLLPDDTKQSLIRAICVIRAKKI